MKLAKITKSDRILLVEVEGSREQLKMYGIDGISWAGVICKTRKAFVEFVKDNADSDYTWKADGALVKYNWRTIDDAWITGYHGDEFYRVEDCENFRLNDIKSLTSGCLETGWDAVIYGDKFQFNVMDNDVLVIRESGEVYDNEYVIDVDQLPEFVA